MKGVRAADSILDHAVKGIESGRHRTRLAALERAAGSKQTQ
jgi:hypothetical protein